MTINGVMTILFKFFIVYILFTGLLEVIGYFLLDKRKGNEILGIRVNVFGLLMELDNMTLLALSVALIRYIFVLWCLFDSSSISFVHILILSVFSVSFGLFSRSIKNLVFEIINAGAIYFALVSSRLLTNYLVEVRYEWYVYAGDIMLKLFIILYATFFLLRNILNSVVKNKYIRRERSDEEDS